MYVAAHYGMYIRAVSALFAPVYVFYSMLDKFDAQDWVVVLALFAFSTDSFHVISA